MDASEATRRDLDGSPNLTDLNIANEADDCPILDEQGLIAPDVDLDKLDPTSHFRDQLEFNSMDLFILC